MKKLMVLLGLSFLSLNLAFADYKLILTDKNGNQNEECIKSYSFYNNLESIARQNGLGKDIYSEVETLTNKVYFGKPVYRKVFKFNDFIVSYSKKNTYKFTPVISNDFDDLVDMSFKGYLDDMLISANNSLYAIYGNAGNQLIRGAFSKSQKKAYITLRQSIKGANPKIWNISDLSITVEYTKTTDKANIFTEKFKSYLHYVASGAKDGEFISIDLKNVGVQILEDYIYDKDLESCTKK